MLKPNEIERFSMLFDPQCKALEMRIMEDIIRRIRINGEITSAADWQINRLYELGVSKREIKKIIQRTLKLDKAEISHLYKQVLRMGYARMAELYKAKGRPWIPFEDNYGLQQLIAAVAEQTDQTLQNITQSLGFAVRMPSGQLAFQPIAEYYQRTLDAAMLDISSGAFDYNTVLKHTVKEMTNSGLRTVDYATGHSNRIEVAARRAVMTGLTQLTDKVTQDTARELETDMWEITWHSGARPTHWWGGRWYSSADLVKVCGYGTVTGLCGANCYHQKFPVIPGISEPTYTQEELDRLNAEEQKPREFGGKTYTKYEALQRQRRLETTMRAQRQEIRLLQDGGAPDEDVTAARARYRGTSAEYTRFSEAVDLPQQRERVTVDGLGNIGVGKYTGGSDRKAMQQRVGSHVTGTVSDQERAELLEHPRIAYPQTGVPLKSGAEITFARIDSEKAVSAEFAAEMCEEYDKFTETFGELPNLRDIHSGRYQGDGVWGQFIQEERVIELYGIGGKNGKKQITQIAQQEKANGQWSTSSPFHPLRHELGHALQQQHELTDPNWTAKREEIENLRKSIVNDLTNPDGSVKMKEMKGKLSKYGFNDTDEFISESVAEYLNNPEKTRSTAKKVIEILQRGEAFYVDGNP